MTNIISINGPEAIWLVADRRLSRAGQDVGNDARKLMVLETTDGIAILGYAGLGATELGNEPSDWMNAVLRGRNLPLELSLQVLARALNEQFPLHLVQMQVERPAHGILAAAFVENEPKLYTIELVFALDRKSYRFEIKRLSDRLPNLGTEFTPRFGLGGSGGLYLIKRRKVWARPLLHLVKAHDLGRVSPHAVADYLAKLNYEAHRNTPRQSVGDRCIVAWRYRRKGIRQNGGGASVSYTGTTRDVRGASFPIMWNGRDMIALSDALSSHAMSVFTGQAEAITIGEKLNLLPDKPDESLR